MNCAREQVERIAKIAVELVVGDTTHREGIDQYLLGPPIPSPLLPWVGEPNVPPDDKKAKVDGVGTPEPSSEVAGMGHVV